MAGSYFGIQCEFDQSLVLEQIEHAVSEHKAGYVIALDGNNFAIAQKNPEHLQLINSSIVTHCDSSWLPLFINKIHKTTFSNYYSADLFFELIRRKQYRHFFLGSNQRVLDSLKQTLTQYDSAISSMRFVELPYANVQDFDYENIADCINEDKPDLIWVSLGCPKQEQFMQRLQPYLNQGVMFGSGALFNFYCGLDDVPQRAPKWMITHHLEFVYRICSEPKKQIPRCLRILSVLPKALLKERKSSTHTNS